MPKRSSLRCAQPGFCRTCGRAIEGDNLLEYFEIVEPPAMRMYVRRLVKCATCWYSPQLRRQREQYATVIVPERERRDAEKLASVS
jgi:hypothetical protein